MTKTSIIKLQKNLDLTDLAGEKVMIDFETGKYFLLHGPANEIWELIQSEITVSEIVSKLLAIYDVSEEECYSSTMDFLNQLQKNDFIIISE